MDTTLICGIHGEPFLRPTASTAAGWTCPIIHAPEEPFVFKPRTIRVPHPWKVVKELDDGAWYQNKPSRIAVLVSGCIEADQRRWIHVSVSRPERHPSHEDLAFVKDHFIGPETYAYTVYPPRSKHVNIHPNCLHLWSPLDGPILPEFSGIIGGIRTI